MTKTKMKIYSDCRQQNKNEMKRLGKDDLGRYPVRLNHD